MKVLRGLPLLACLAPLSCTPSVGATAGRALGEATTVGVTARALLQTPRGYDHVVGAQVDLLAQADPRTYVDQARISGVLGYGSLPDAHDSFLGWLVLARAGFARGAYGSEVTPFALQGGLSFELPMRLSAKQTPWKADTIADTSLLLIPAFNATELYAFDVSSHAQTELGGSLSLGVRVWSGLVP